MIDEPEVYGLPPDPVVPTRDAAAMWKYAGMARVGVGRRGGVGVRRAGKVVTHKDIHAQMYGRGGGAREHLAVPRAEFRSYYFGRPVLKEPVWEWKIAAYLFTGGFGDAGGRGRPDRTAGTTPGEQRRCRRRGRCPTCGDRSTTSMLRSRSCLTARVRHACEVSAAETVGD